MALAVAITFSTTGQEEPLPVVHAKASASDLPVPRPAAYLTVALNRPFDPSLLAEAARANDFAAFDALYRGARKLGQPVAAYSTLHELWSWSMSDPIGAFYGRDIHERFASAFPGYARFIEEYSIVDNNGNAFYPTSETRAFLLARALEGQAASSPLITKTARARSGEQRDTTSTTTHVSATTSHKSTTTSHAFTTRQPAATQPARSTAQRSTTPHSVPRSHHSRKVQTDVASKPAVSTTATSTPSTSTPAVTKPAASKPAVSTPVASTPAAQTPAAQTPVTTTPATSSSTTPAPAPTTSATDTAAPTEAPIVVKAEEPAPATAVPTETQSNPQTAATNNPFSGRGMLLLVIGLIGFGILALILRTPKEVPTSILPPADGTKPPAPVEPFRKTPAPGSIPGSTKSEDSTKPRATGSRG